MVVARRAHDAKLNIAKRVLAAVLTMSCAVTSLALVSPPITAQAARGKKLTLKAARSLALEASTDYEAAGDKIVAKQAAYESAVKSITLKKKSMSTFRWSPLLSFKFPTTPDFGEASEFSFKPTSLAYDVKVAQHNMQDKVF